MLLLAMPLLRVTSVDLLGDLLGRCALLFDCFGDGRGDLADLADGGADALDGIDGISGRVHRLGGLVQLQRRCRHRLDEVRHFALEAFGMFAELGRRHTLGGMGADCGEYLNIE